MEKFNNSIPYIEYNDRHISKSSKKNIETFNIQTPQGFDYKLILKAHRKYKNKNFSDDASLIQQYKLKINFLKSEKTNIKLTYPEDLIYLNVFKKPIIKSGIGYDIHQIDKKSVTGLKLCGVKIPFSKLIIGIDEPGENILCFNSLLIILNINLFEVSIFSFFNSGDFIINLI